MEMSLALEMCITDALFRIKRDYERCQGKIYLSFSGGKDSTVLGELIKMAELPTDIPFVFCDTGIEMEAIRNFVKEFDYPNIVTVKPKKPFPLILKEDGKPVCSKMKSQFLGRYQVYLKDGRDPMGIQMTRQLISGEAENGNIKKGFRSNNALALKHFNLLWPDLEYKISSKCCDFLKKEPFQRYAKENDMSGVFMGVRNQEGGARSMVYRECVQIRIKRGREEVTSFPIIDWTDENIEEFINYFGIKVSIAYTKYGLDRTGCAGCPFGKILDVELKALYDHEPQKYKGMLFMLKDVYADMGVMLPFDPEYMEYYKEREKINEVRRFKMYEHFKDHFNPKIRKKGLKKPESLE